MDDKDFKASLKAISGATHYDSLWESFISSLGKVGVDLISYHHIAPHHSPDSGRIDILTYGYPSVWETFCRNENLSAYNPVFNMAYTRTDVFRWSEILDQPPKSEPESKFIRTLKEWMKGDGFIIPVFGPSGRNGYVAAGNLASIEDWTVNCLQQIKSLSQDFHLRYVAFRLSELPSDFSVNDDDHKILSEIAEGKGLQSISADLDISPEKITATIDKLMLTMGVSDLASLMIRANSLGLIKSVDFVD